LETGNKTISYSCLQPGANCLIRSESNQNFENDVLEVFIHAFPNINIQDAVDDNRYSICKNGQNFELKILDDNQLVSSQLYLSAQLYNDKNTN